MNLQEVIAELSAERDRLDRAIAALEDSAPRRGRPPKTTFGSKRRPMSAAARARIGAAKKAWWAKRKSKRAGANRKPTRVVKRTPMSPAMRKKLSVMMKARWSDRKKAA